MDSFLLILIIGILLIYFFSNSNVYKALYKKVNEEKNILQKENEKLQTIIQRYEKQAKVNIETLRENQDLLQVARDDLQKLRIENTQLKHQVNILEKRTQELYAQINTVL